MNIRLHRSVMVLRKTIGKQVAQVIDIVYYPYLDFSMGFVIVVGERKLLQMAENIGPQLVDDGLANRLVILILAFRETTEYSIISSV